MSYSVVILSKNADNVEACVSSIREAGEDCPVIIADDGLSRRRDDCIYLEGPKPFNFARNSNLGLAVAFENGCEAACLLNDDTRLLTPRGFSLMHALEKTGCGVVSCAITDAVGNLQQLPKGQGLRYADRTVAFIAVWILASTWERIGKLDERFGVTSYGWEDNDYNRRVLEAGLKLGVYDGCIVEHGVLPSTFRPGNVSVPISDGSETFREKWGTRM